MDNMLTAMTVFALVGAISPGPVNIIATSTAMHKGIGVAARHVAGASVSYAVVVLLCGLFLTTVANWTPAITQVLTYAGSVFLLYLSYKIFTAPVQGEIDESIDEKTSRYGWWTGYFAQSLNPKAWLVAMSGVSLFVVGQDEKWLTIYVLVSLVVCLFSIGAWAALGRILVRLLANPTHQKRFNQVMGILLALSVVAIWK